MVGGGNLQEFKHRKPTRDEREPPFCARGVRRVDIDSTQARSPHRQARPRTLSAAHTNPLRRIQVSPTRPSRHRDVHDQTPPGSPRTRPILTLPMPRSPLDGPHAQCHDSVTCRGFLLSRSSHFRRSASQWMQMRPGMCKAAAEAADRGLALMICFHKQEAALATWFVEAFQCDRATVD